MYADLCVRLSQQAKRNSFIHIIESDEEPLMEGETETMVNKDGLITYRWTNDVNTDDQEIVGPFDTPEDCLIAASSENPPPPIPRNDMELDLHVLNIKEGSFVKILKPKVQIDHNHPTYYTVFFPVSQADEVGQQFSKGVFLSERECIKNAQKENSFKRILLNKCEDELMIPHRYHPN